MTFEDRVEEEARQIYKVLCPFAMHEDKDGKPWPIEKSTTMRAFIIGSNWGKEQSDSKVESIAKHIRRRLDGAIFFPVFNRFLCVDDLQKYFEEHPDAFEYRKDV